MGGLSHLNDWLAGMKQDARWNTALLSACSATSGAVFGAALTAARVHLPEIIVGQFRLTDFRMFQVFSVACGTSVFIILVLDKLNIAKRQVRQNTSLGLFSQYDGNIVGGALVGLGMSMSGSCPGTVTAQLAQGVPTAGVTALGGILGGISYLLITRPVRRRPRRSQSRVSPSRPQYTPPRTITAATGISESVLVPAIGIALVSLLYFSASTAEQSFWRTPAAGGLYLGAAQLVSILATSSGLSASGMYDQAGRYALRILGYKEIPPAPMPPTSLIFGLGAVAGSMALTQVMPGMRPSTIQSDVLSYTSAFFGGVIMAFGSRVAQGCTSGHGLTGMGALSFPSLLSVASMFGMGILSQFI